MMIFSGTLSGHNNDWKTVYFNRILHYIEHFQWHPAEILGNKLLPGSIHVLVIVVGFCYQRILPLLQWWSTLGVCECNSQFLHLHSTDWVFSAQSRTNCIYIHSLNRTLSKHEHVECYLSWYCPASLKLVPVKKIVWIFFLHFKICCELSAAK